MRGEKKERKEERGIHISGRKEKEQRKMEQPK